MCGFVGSYGASLPRHELREAIEAGLDAIVHRGPDDCGVYIDEASGVALGHRRLSIIDVSEAGHQPMVSADGRFVLAFNGEIYNHLDIRAELEYDGPKIAWCGHSDTETLLAAFSLWGIERTLARASGMFAIALWDRHTKAILLARDRFGEKPLFYSIRGGVLLFGSDITSFRRWPGVERSLDPETVALYVRFGWVPGNRCILKGFEKLQPGSWMTVSEEELSGKSRAQPRAYWSLEDVVSRGRKDKWSGSYEQALSALEHVLSESVGRQMLSDVSLGAFLSGGVDSSIVVSFMQRQIGERVKTYSIGFCDKRFDEAAEARKVAAFLGTDHLELYVGSEDLENVVPELGSIYAEPFADASQIPMLVLARMTRKHVKVALSGDGGDEMFGGYSRHFRGGALWRNVCPWPAPVRAVLGRAISSVDARTWDGLYARLEPLVPERWRARLPGAKLKKLGVALGARDVREYYAHFLMANGANVLQFPDGDWRRVIRQEAGGLAPEEYMMLCDGMHYLPGDVLVKVDQSTMAASLEARAPFLSETVAEFAWRLPLEFRVMGGAGKRILRDLLARHMPAELISRPKAGFTPPLGDWLRRSLRPWAEGLLEKRKVEEGGFFDAGVVRRLWEAFVRDRSVDERLIWNVLMFQAWREKWGV